MDRCEDIFRAADLGVELRSAGDGATLAGHFARFNEWTEIDSAWEGNFMERIAPGAFKKTFREGKDRIKVLFQHGKDPQLGDKPLGAIRSLQEDDDGAFYEVDLLRDESGSVVDYLRGIVPGLKQGLYGSSFRFSVVKEDFNREAGKSSHNPKGLPERTIQEARVMEFGPVTFPAYAGATASVRSITDEQKFPPEVLELIEAMVEKRAAALRNDGTPVSWVKANVPEPARLQEIEEGVNDAPVVEDESRRTQEEEQTPEPEEAVPSWQLRR